MSRMISGSPEPPVVRLPRQDRSRLAWQRILDSGVEVLCEVGVARFNISAVCERAGVAMTAVYSRVGSRDDLLHATYDHGVADVQATERELTAAQDRPGSRAAVDVLIGVFARHSRFLRPTILGANEDAYLAARGADNLERARQQFVRTAAGDDAPAHLEERATTLFTATFSIMAFELAFGSQLAHSRGREGTSSQLHMLADALVPEC